jgi:hypothetical protein
VVPPNSRRRDRASFRPITWLSDRQKGLIRAVAEVRPNDCHGFCLIHLIRNFKEEFKAVNLQPLICRAAWATHESEYQTVMEEMATFDPDAPAWFVEFADPYYWSEAFFHATRY